MNSAMVIDLADARKRLRPHLRLVVDNDAGQQMAIQQEVEALEICESESFADRFVPNINLVLRAFE